MRNPKPFTVIQNGKPIFTVTAYSIEQARAIVAAKVAGEVIVVAVTRDGAADDPGHQERPSGDGLHLSNAEKRPARP